jgi:23S rRNA pseudouridine955/2504/2580 synthase
MKKPDFKSLIIFENEDYLAINKPAGISTLEDRTNENHLLSIARVHFGDIQVCHRLDKDTSGVLIFAKSPESYRHLSMQFQNRQVDKTYHAVVHGQTDFDHQIVDVPLETRNHGKVRWDHKTGKESITHFSTIQNFKSNSLLACVPVTGRRHQIRVHFNYLNYSIVADTMYGGELIYLSQIKRKYKPGQRDERPIMDRMALHARNIKFKSTSNREISIEADYPKDFNILLKQLKKYSEI